jgi:hypothetical protein
MGRTQTRISDADKQATYRARKGAKDAQAHALAERARLVVEAARRRGIAAENTPDAEVLERVAAVLSGTSSAAPFEKVFPTF